MPEESLSALHARLSAHLASRMGEETSRQAPAMQWVSLAPGDARLCLGYTASRAATEEDLAALGAQLGLPDHRVRWIRSTSIPTAQGWLCPENLDHSGGFGTMGAVVRARTPDAALYAVTAGHVLASDPAARAGDRVRLSQDSPPKVVRGTLTKWSPDLSSRGRNAMFDAALMRIDPLDLESLVDDIAWPTTWADAPLGTNVFLLTRQHRMPGRVTAIISTMVQAGDPPQQYLLQDALCYQVETETVGGDSGAAVWDEQERLVALHVGEAPEGCPGNAVACPIGRVLDWCNCELLLRNQPLVSEGRMSIAPPAVLPDPPVQPSAEGQASIDVLARTIWGEARGEPNADAGMRAVAHVVLNRRDHPCWWGRSVKGVCLKPFQFSCWNESDPNRTKLLAVGTGDAVFALALSIAAELVALDPTNRARIDTTGGATHYYARNIAAPAWTAHAVLTVRIGNHVFFKDVG